MELAGILDHVVGVVIATSNVAFPNDNYVLR
jgi:hypothetical protein